MIYFQELVLSALSQWWVFICILTHSLIHWTLFNSSSTTTFTYWLLVPQIRLSWLIVFVLSLIWGYYINGFCSNLLHFALFCSNLIGNAQKCAFPTKFEQNRPFGNNCKSRVCRGTNAFDSGAAWLIWQYSSGSWFIFLIILTRPMLNFDEINSAFTVPPFKSTRSDLKSEYDRDRM